MTDVRVAVLGARGSIPVSGPEFTRYGGDTTAFAVLVDGTVVAFIDAGTGLSAGHTGGLEVPRDITVLLTHYHWDHIVGLSMSDLVWLPSHRLTIRGPGDPGNALTLAIGPPYFPVSIADAPDVTFDAVDGPVVLPGVTIESFPVHHPQGALGYLVRGPNRSVGIVTDHETGTALDESIQDALDGVEVLVHDAQYLPEEATDHVGWGHSTAEDAVAMAETIGAGRLVLTSHHPARTDVGIDAIVEDARTRFDATVAAAPGLEIPL